MDLLRVMGVPEEAGSGGGGGGGLRRAAVRQAGDSVSVKGSASEMVVRYTANTPNDARVAFERSLRTWADAFPSAVTIRIGFTWEAIQGGTLAATTTPYFVPGSRGDRLTDDTYYGSVMAASLEGRDFINDGDDHILMTFNSRVNWHFGEGNTPFDKWDMATTSLHEQCHGLFFSGVVQASPQQRIANFDSDGNQPGRFDRFLAASSSTSVASVCSSDLGNFYNAITNSGLRFTDSDVPGTDFSLYSPTTYQPGSSTYHHDPERLASDCDNNEIPSDQCSDLMTQKLPNGYTQRDIGAPVMRMLSSMRGASTGATGNANCNVAAGVPGAGESSSGGQNGSFGTTFNLPRWAIYTVAGIGAVGLVMLIGGLVSSISGRGK